MAETDILVPDKLVHWADVAIEREVLKTLLQRWLGILLIASHTVDVDERKNIAAVSLLAIANIGIVEIIMDDATLM